MKYIFKMWDSSSGLVSMIIFQFIAIYMLHNNALYVCENNIIAPYRVTLF